MVVSYYRSLAYGDLERELQSRKHSGQGGMEATADLYWKWMVKPERMVSDSEDYKNSV